MAEERCLILLKPGVLQRGIAGEVLSRFERKRLRITALKVTRMSGEQAAAFYAHHAGKPFLPSLVAYMSSGPVVAAVLEGDGAISSARRLSGPTRPDEAPPGTIRGDFAVHTAENVVHVSDSPESAEREIALFFAPQEIHSYPETLERWV